MLEAGRLGEGRSKQPHSLRTEVGAESSSDHCKGGSRSITTGVMQFISCSHVWKQSHTLKLLRPYCSKAGQSVYANQCTPIRLATPFDILTPSTPQTRSHVCSLVCSLSHKPWVSNPGLPGAVRHRHKAPACPSNSRRQEGPGDAHDKGRKASHTQAESIQHHAMPTRVSASESPSPEQITLAYPGLGGSGCVAVCRSFCLTLHGCKPDQCLTPDQYLAGECDVAACVLISECRMSATSSLISILVSNCCVQAHSCISEI